MAVFLIIYKDKASGESESGQLAVGGLFAIVETTYGLSSRAKRGNLGSICNEVRSVSYQVDPEIPRFARDDNLQSYEAFDKDCPLPTRSKVLQHLNHLFPLQDDITDAVVAYTFF
jgi:hypothetical protein